MAKKTKIDPEMYYCSTSTLDINPETKVLTLETMSINPKGVPTSGSTTTTRPTSTPKLTTAARIAALEQLILDNHDDSQLRRVDMARLLGVGLSRIKDDLRLLAAQGKVVFVGVGSHSGHWHIVGNPETEVEVKQWLSSPGYGLLHGSRGRHSAKSTQTFSLQHSHTSTPAHTMSPDITASAVAHAALNCALAAVQTPYAQRRDICCTPYRWHTPFFFTRRLWQDALAPLQRPLSRG